VLGRYPTPVRRLDSLSRPGCELWVKRDDLTASIYGGNKVRKLERILEDATAKHARRIVTFGAAGSHHVLATAVYGRQAGIGVAAILTPQVRSAHAVDNLRAALCAGLEAHAATGPAGLPLCLARTLARGDYVVPPGGSSVVGTLGYAAAGTEIAEQIRDGSLPAPDVIVVALGSGGTAAGLVAGLAAERMAVKVVAVRVVHPLFAGRGRTLALAALAARRAGYREAVGSLAERLEIEHRFAGPGYAEPSAAGARAADLATGEGLLLEQTYTAKAFAAALDRVAEGRYTRVLFWHTFSSAPIAPLLEMAPAEADLPARLRGLFTEPAIRGPGRATPIS
jgi:1-aminocyclopropane-1-carboxylate deaminase/D-cysteine desulfhydrase-like pyridoxal-dependent ACC family enzyme